MATVSVDHVVTRDQVVWGFGPEMEPVLEVEPGAVVRFETNDCFTGQIQSEEDLVTGIDFDRVNSATGPVAVTGAEPGDSLIVEILEVKTVATGVATIIPGIGQLIDQVRAPLTQVFQVEGETVHMNDRISFPLRPMVGVVGVATGGETISNAYAGSTAATSTTTSTARVHASTSLCGSPARCSASATCTPPWVTARSAARGWRSPAR